MTRSSERLVRYWDRRSIDYDARTAAVERRFLAANRRWVCERAVGTTLEIAVGNGANLEFYSPSIELTGVDWSPGMLRGAAERARLIGREIALERADAAALPFPPAAFDSVVCTFALCCVPDEPAVLAEARRVLRPGGSLLLADHVAAASWPLRALQRAAEWITIRTQGEHYTRRPLVTVTGLGMPVEESARLSLGLIERVHARKPG